MEAMLDKLPNLNTKIAVLAYIVNSVIKEQSKKITASKNESSQEQPELLKNPEKPKEQSIYAYCDALDLYIDMKTQYNIPKIKYVTIIKCVAKIMRENMIQMQEI